MFDALVRVRWAGGECAVKVKSYTCTVNNRKRRTQKDDSVGMEGRGGAGD